MYLITETFFIILERSFVPSMSKFTKSQKPIKTIIQEVRSKSNYNKLRKNVIEEYLQSILKPYNFMAAIFFCAKYKIQDGFIFSNDFRYNIISFFGLLSIFTVCVYRVIDNILGTIREESFFYTSFILVCEFVLFLFGFPMSYIMNVIHMYNNVTLVLKIQEVHKILRIKKKCFNKSILLNSIPVIIVNCFYITWILFFIFFYKLSAPFKYVTLYVYIFFDINFLYATKIVKVLTKFTNIMIEDMQRAELKEDVEELFDWNKVFVVYKKLLKAYEIVNQSSQQLVSILA